MNFQRKQLYNPIAIGIAILLLIVALFSMLWVLVPPPPKIIEMATGFPTGLYFHFGERLKSSLAKEGVTLELKTTGGTIDNLSLLEDPRSGIDFAMVQGGVADVAKHPNLVSLAGMFYEPIWIWYREPAFKADGGRLSILSQLKGKRVSIGNDGSGTLALSKALLQVSGISDEELHAEKFMPDEALAKLKSGELDAVFIVAAAEAPILEKFYTIPGVRLMSFEQADAYTRNLPYLSKVNIPRGVVSIANDLPRQDIVVLAPTATLVGHADISPALVTLLLGDTYDILKSYSRLHKPGDFPSCTGLDFPLHAYADIYLKDVPSFLHR